MSAAPVTHYLALSGGVGGAKLALGLMHVLGAGLTVAINTGDDFEHLGLHVSPDVDTAMYTLADLVNPETGWGRKDETWTFMAALKAMGGPAWFNLGDGDLALHVERTRRLRAGEPLSAIIDDVRQKFGIPSPILPMSDDPVRTFVDTDLGTLEFQQYFVREQCRPKVMAIRFEGADKARPLPALQQALMQPNPSVNKLGGIIICPSNPYLSVDPILAIPGLRDLLRGAGVPVVAVSPIVGGKAIKGPTSKIMGELGLPSDAIAVAHHYRGLIDGFVLDATDANLQDKLEIPVHVTNTIMHTLDDKILLAKACIAFCERLRTGQGARTA
jgi:LPPG:FO 2-phospho-L-lactate transferase